MSSTSLTLPPGNYIIGDPDYFRNNEPYVFFWTNGDGAFYDNFNNCYFVDSARIAIFAVKRKPDLLPQGTHHFVFKDTWTIDFDTHALSEEIKIARSEHS